MQQPKKIKIISLSITPIRFTQALEKVAELGFAHQSSFVCFANAHMTVEAYKDAQFLYFLNQATLVLADGKPIAKACAFFYGIKQERIAGMDFMPALLKHVNQLNKVVKVFLLGSTQEMITAIKQKIKITYTQIEIVGNATPPFREFSMEETTEIIDSINQSGAHIVFVSLGCPKQEKWMAENFKSINAVLLGVGGAFSVFTGLKSRAPKWMQEYGFEWLYRLLQEPNRLFKRYAYTNIFFVWLFLKECTNKRSY